MYKKFVGRSHKATMFITEKHVRTAVTQFTKFETSMIFLLI